MVAAKNELVMPRTVLWSLIAQAVELVWGALHFLSGPEVLVTGPVLFGFGFSTVLLFAIALRRNWARIAWVMLYVFDSATEPFRSWVLSRHGGSAAAPGAADAMLILVDVIALALVFLPGSARWFIAAAGGHSGQHSASSAG